MWLHHLLVVNYMCYKDKVLAGSHPTPHTLALVIVSPLCFCNRFIYGVGSDPVEVLYCVCGVYLDTKRAW